MSLELIAIIFSGGFVFTVTFLIARIVLYPRVALDDLTTQEQVRVGTLRRSSLIYRYLEPLMETISQHRWAGILVDRKGLKRHVQGGAQKLPFNAKELASITILRSAFLTIGACLLMSNMVSTFACLFAFPILFLLISRINCLRLSCATSDVHHSIAKRLPHATDLLAMQLSAGASFRRSFEIIATEMSGSELGKEFAKVMRDFDRGLSLEEAMAGLGERVPVPEISEFSTAICTSHRRGTPLAKTLLNLADQMRQHRTERAEVAAGKAQANITFPGLIMMGACLLILLAPFALHAIQENPFDF